MNSDISITNNDEDINEILFKSNTLIKGIINLTSNEYKIFNKILYKCQIIKDNEQQMMCKLTLEELKELVKNKTENKPKALLGQLERFMKIIIRFKKDKEFISTTLINTVKVDEETLDFDCYLNKEMFQVLMGYKEIGYSAINLKMIKQSNGYYTQRFYELFRIWSGTKKEVEYKISYLKDWLMIPQGSSYDTYANFKNKIIKPSLKEISEKLNMTISFTEKKGR